MASPDDDAPESFDDEPTHLDEKAPLATTDQTRAFKSAEFLSGRQVGFIEGVDAAISSLRLELVRAQCTEEEIRHIVARVRAGSSSRA